MRSGTLKFLLQCLTRSDNTRLSFRFTGMIHKRILNRMIGEIGVPQIQRCMCIISSYIPDSRAPHPVRIRLTKEVLKIIKESPHISRRWFPLLLELPDPILNNLVANAKNNGEAGW